jgi:precorrin-6A/cobalt-precorrin-6A reductase
VLDHPQSVQAALSAGIPKQNIIKGRGPFSIQQNVAVIKEYNIGALVTKDSGEAGGVPAKLEAARAAGCRVVVIRRPDELIGHCYDDVSELVRAVRLALGTGGEAAKSRANGTNRRSKPR